MRRVRVLISGRVQGVGFRWICAQEADARGVAGHVRNLPDGRVEAEFEGPDEAVASMLEWARGGPDWAEVDDVAASDLAPQGESGFTIRR